MEKYGVLEDPDITKTAEKEDDEPKHCPSCGRKLVPNEHTNVLKCPRCGTKPFER